MSFPRWAGRELRWGVHTLRILWARVLPLGLVGLALGLGLSSAPVKPQGESVLASPRPAAPRPSGAEIDTQKEATPELVTRVPYT